MTEEYRDLPDGLNEYEVKEFLDNLYIHSTGSTDPVNFTSGTPIAEIGAFENKRVMAYLVRKKFIRVITPKGLRALYFTKSGLEYYISKCLNQPDLLDQSKLAKEETLRFNFNVQMSIHIGYKGKTGGGIVSVGGKDFTLTKRSFALFLRLVLGALQGQGGWIALDTLVGEYYVPFGLEHQAFSQLRQQFAAIQVSPKKLIESSGSKEIRLSVPPSLISCNSNELTHHPDPKIQSLIAKIDSTINKS